MDKKSIVKATIILLLTIAVMAQISLAEEKEISFGIRVGAGSSFSHPTNTVSAFYVQRDFPTGLSYYAGGFANIPLNTRWSIQPEILLKNESVKMVETDTGSIAFTSENGQMLGKAKNYTFTLDHVITSLQIPVLLMYSFGERKNGQINVFLGPNFSYITSVKATGKFRDSTDESIILFSGEKYPDFSTDISKVNNFQVGITVGCNYFFMENIMADMRYNYNLTTAFEQWGLGARISTLHLGIGYLF